MGKFKVSHDVVFNEANISCSKLDTTFTLIFNNEQGKSNGAMVDHELDQVQELEIVTNFKHYEVGLGDVNHGIRGDVGKGDVGDVVEGGAIVHIAIKYNHNIIEIGEPQTI